MYNYSNYQAGQVFENMFWPPPEVELPEALLFPFFTKRPTLHMTSNYDIDYFISTLEELSQLMHEIAINTPLPGSQVNLVLREYLLLHITTFVNVAFRETDFMDMLEPKHKHDDKIINFLSFLRECRHEFIRRWDRVCWLERNVVNANVHCLNDANNENRNGSSIYSPKSSNNNNNTSIRVCKNEIEYAKNENEVASHNVLKANNVYRKEGSTSNNNSIYKCEKLHSVEVMKRRAYRPRYTTKTKYELLKKINKSANDKMSSDEICQIRECWTSVKLCADAISLQTSAVDSIRERLTIKHSFRQFLMMCVQKCCKSSKVCTTCLYVNLFIVVVIIALTWLMWRFQESAFPCAVLSTVLCAASFLLSMFFVTFTTQKNREDVNFYSSLLTMNVAKSYFFHSIAEKLSIRNKSERELSMSAYTFDCNTPRLLQIKEIILDKMIIMIGVTCLTELRICVWNVGAQRATGIKEEQMIGKSLEAVLDIESMSVARALLLNAENVSQEPRRIVINSFAKNSVMINAVATTAHIDGVMTLMLIGNVVEEDDHVMASYLSHTALTALQMKMEENDISLVTYSSLLNETTWNATRERSANARQCWRLSTLTYLLSPLEALHNRHGQQHDESEQQQEQQQQQFTDKLVNGKCSSKNNWICVNVFINEHVPEEFECETVKVHGLFTEICRVTEYLNDKIKKKETTLTDNGKCDAKSEAAIENNKSLREVATSHSDLNNEFCSNLNEGNNYSNGNINNKNIKNKIENNNCNSISMSSNINENINDGNVKMNYDSDSDSDSENDVDYASCNKRVNPGALKRTKLNVCLEWCCNVNFRCHLMQVVVEIIPVRGIFALSNFNNLSKIAQECGYLISTERNQFTVAVPVSVSLLTSNHLHLQMCQENQIQLQEYLTNNETSPVFRMNYDYNNDNNNDNNGNSDYKNNCISAADKIRITEWLKSQSNDTVTENKLSLKKQSGTVEKGRSSFLLPSSLTKTKVARLETPIPQNAFMTNAKQMLLCTFIICEPDEVYLAHLRNLCSLYQHRVFFTESMETFLPLMRTFGNDLTAVIVSCASEQYHEFRQTCHEYNVKFVATEDRDVVGLVAFSASKNDGPPANCSDVHYVLHKPIEMNSWIRFLEFLHEVKVKQQIISCPTRNELHKIRKLGEGSNSRVDLVSEEFTGGVFALKTVFTAEGNAAGTSSEEVEILMYLGNHPNIVQYIRSYYNNRNQLCICLEHCKEGNLATYVSTLPCHRLTLMHFASIAFQMIDVLQYMHGKGVAHRDINPSNILLYNMMHAKLADFGSATRYPQLAGKVCGGTIRYIAPERLIEIDNYKWYKNEMERLYAEDVWSLGITFLDLLGTCPTLEREMNDVSHFVEFYLNLRDTNKELKFEISLEVITNDSEEERVWSINSSSSSNNNNKQHNINNAKDNDATDLNKLSKHCTLSSNNTTDNNVFGQHGLAPDGSKEEEHTEFELNLVNQYNDHQKTRKTTNNEHASLFSNEDEDKALLNLLYADVKSMISTMLQLHPSKRASAKSLKKCSFMTRYRKWQSKFQRSVPENKR